MQTIVCKKFADFPIQSLFIHAYFAKCRAWLQPVIQYIRAGMSRYEIARMN